MLRTPSNGKENSTALSTRSTNCVKLDEKTEKRWAAGRIINCRQAAKKRKRCEPFQRSVINPRKLAAIDIVFLGSKVIIAEFAGGVLLSVALGAFVLHRGHSFWQFVLGAYLLLLGINYVPMLAYAVAITSGKSAKAEMGDELNDPRRAMAKYRRQSVLLLVPLLVPLLALVRERRKA